MNTFYKDQTFGQDAVKKYMTNYVQAKNISWNGTEIYRVALLFAVMILPVLVVISK